MFANTFSDIMEYVYSTPSSKVVQLKAILEEDSLAKDSFATVGYVLKEGASVGLPAGKYFVYFKCEEAEVAKKLQERLAKLPEATAATEEEKNKVVDAVNAESNAAASGFGAIFG